MFRKKLCQRLALDELHRDEVRPVRLLNRENLDDIRMIQGSDGFCFALKAGAAFFVLGQLIGEDLEGDLPVQLGVFGQIDIAHTAGANLLQDIVVGEGLADHDWTRAAILRGAELRFNYAAGRVPCLPSPLLMMLRSFGLNHYGESA